MSTVGLGTRAPGTVFARTELRKLPAFVRRDFLVAWSYRMSFVSDAVGLAGQALVFYFVGRMVQPDKLPSYGGTRVTYFEFVAVGIALGMFVHFALSRLASVLRTEQLMGTLESLLATPTSISTIQLGSVAWDLIYLPLRTFLFLFAVALGFGLHFEIAGLLPAAAALVIFMPFVWGLGVLAAAMALTFRRGSSMIGLGMIAVALVSGLYFPIELLPNWLSSITRLNPLALATNSIRRALLGGVGWSGIAPDLAVMAPLSLLALGVGFAAFRIALRRERRLGTLGLY